MTADRKDPAPRNGAREESRRPAGARSRNGADAGRTSLGHRFLVFVRRFSRWAVLAVVYLTVLTLLSPTIFDRPMRRLRSLSIDMRVTTPVEAVVTFSVLDEPRLGDRITELRERADLQYVFDDDALQETLQRLDALFVRTVETSEEDEPPEEKRARIVRVREWAAEEFGTAPSADLLEDLAAREDRPEIRSALRSALREVYQSRAVVENLIEYRDMYDQDRVANVALPRSIEAAPHRALSPERLGAYLEEEHFLSRNAADRLNSAALALMGRLAEWAAQPSLVFSPERTEAHLRDDIEALRSSPPSDVMETFRKGDTILEANETVTSEALLILREMDRTYRRSAWKSLLAQAVFTALLLALALYYFRQFRPDLHFTISNILLVSLHLLVPLVVGRIMLLVLNDPESAAYGFPAALIGMLAVILLDSRTGILLVTIGCLAFSVATGLDFKVFITLLLGGYAAVAVLTTVKQRKDVLWAGMIVALVNAIVVLIVGAIDDPANPRLNLMVWGLFNGGVCAFAAMPVLAIFERAFDVVTDIRLLELTGLDNPLLQELEEKAPGSYQHSLNVCKLSEAAAKEIDANYLLVRAGSYYHDVGKVLKPKYFGENQISIDDKSLHSKLSPYMSAMIIKNHVKAGMELARKHRLPERVVDFIPEHQGTTIITFFYHQALKRFENSQSTDPVREEDFRYPGPKPQSIETAIVMLADTVEATVTSRFTSLSVNEDELQLCVQKTINDKFADGQFDECDLTLRDLHLIRESFVRTLLSRFHHRVAYPTRPGLSGPSAPTPKRDRLERK